MLKYQFLKYMKKILNVSKEFGILVLIFIDNADKFKLVYDFLISGGK
jgi:hypothetical protein